MNIVIDGDTLISAEELGEKFIVPNGIAKIGDCCIKNSPDLKEIVLPEDLKRIGEYAFSEAPNLERFNLPRSIEFVKSSFIYGCKLIHEVRADALPVHVFDEKEWGTYCYSCCMVPEESENGMSLTAVGAPELDPKPVRTPIKKIIFTTSCKPRYTYEGLFLWWGDHDHFGAVDVEEFVVEEGNKYLSSHDGILYDKKAKKLLRCPSAIKADVITMPSSVKLIGNHAFADCVNVKHIALSPNVRRVNWAAFLHCVNLEELILPSSFEYLNNHYESTWVAMDCTNLKHILLLSNEVAGFNPGVTTTWYVKDSLVKEYIEKLPTWDPDEPFLPRGVEFKEIKSLAEYPRDAWRPEWLTPDLLYKDQNPSPADDN